MLAQLIKRGKTMLQGEKAVRVLVLLGGAGMLLILLSGWLPKKEDAEEAATDTAAATDTTTGEAYCRDLENRLETVLEAMDGVGECTVMLTCTGTGETVYAADTETETSDTKVQVQQNYVLFTDSDGQSPLVQQVLVPQLSGALVVCQGASASVTQEKVTKAVQAVLGLPSNRILVVSG